MNVMSDIAYIATKNTCTFTFLLHTNFSFFYPHAEIYLLVSVYPDKAEDSNQYDCLQFQKGVTT